MINYNRPRNYSNFRGKKKTNSRLRLKLKRQIKKNCSLWKRKKIIVVCLSVKFEKIPSKLHPKKKGTVVKNFKLKFTKYPIKEGGN